MKTAALITQQKVESFSLLLPCNMLHPSEQNQGYNTIIGQIELFISNQLPVSAHVLNWFITSMETQNNTLIYHLEGSCVY